MKPPAENTTPLKVPGLQKQVLNLEYINARPE